MRTNLNFFKEFNKDHFNHKVGQSKCNKHAKNQNLIQNQEKNYQRDKHNRHRWAIQILV